MSRAYSEDLRIRVVRFVEKGGSRRAAAKLFGVSASSAVKWLQRWQLKKSVSPNPIRGHRRAVLEPHADWLLELVRAKPDLALWEISAELAKRNVHASLSTIWAFYDRHDVSYKKKCFRQRAGSARRSRRARALAPKPEAA